MTFDPRHILREIRTTERSLTLRERDNAYVFSVATDANKSQIKFAVESLFRVKVVQVRTQVVRGKRKRLGRFEGRQPGWKKAIVKLAQGEKIEALEVG